MGEAQVREDGTVMRSAEYVGSFSVDDCCLDDQIEQLHTQLKLLKSCKRRRPVSLKFSIKGVKMYDEDETTLLMAHALRRVSLSTARPFDTQFAFVSHNPGSADAQLYCHVFQARHSRAAQFLNLLLCRCFQLCYLAKHPEEAQKDSVGSMPRRNHSLLNHGFPLSVSALVSFRRAPFQGLLPGIKKNRKSSDDLHSSPDEVFPTSSPSLVRKKAIRTKALRSGAYRSFTFTPLKQRSVQERLSASQGGASVHRVLSKVKELIRRGHRRSAGEEIPHAKLGRNRGSAGSGSVVLGWYRNMMFWDRTSCALILKNLKVALSSFASPLA
ncbi:SH2 domain-containing protein 5 isoform X2 [Anarrhichthys ocellatus]|uniref:SH2 domain-containing protein 5 isoform X2 n=1 Tax=Anarrhichthys ocellatus TaxID=433405 RepID=UPI0012EE0175|nr:SH2 domain-containing protein 5 isoform X2 [Anarrhichthys ocellatus]